MGQTERLYKIRHLLDAGRCLRPAQLRQMLEVSDSTIKRDMRHLRERMNAPVVWCDDQNGWMLDRRQAIVGDQYELPGLWFSSEEVHALLTMQHLISQLDAGGLLASHIAPLKQRLSQMLDDGLPGNAEVARRIKVISIGARRVQLPHFQSVGSALLRRKRLLLHYHGRTRDAADQREVSPQRLVHYRDNWYLDAWCHWRQGLRSFAVDAIEQVRILDLDAIDMPEAELDAELGAGYGIFAGPAAQWAHLRFSAARARWVAKERWHPDQRGSMDAVGRWNLSLPFSDLRELVMDILRHVPEVEVIGPQELRAEVARRLKEGLLKMELEE